VHWEYRHYAGRERFDEIKGAMPRPKAHFSVIVKNHVTGARLKVELVDVPFVETRRFRLRVNGQWARKLPVATKTVVLQQIRSWLAKQ
jgi:hypothetical protein